MLRSASDDKASCYRCVMLSCVYLCRSSEDWRLRWYCRVVGSDGSARDLQATVVDIWGVQSLHTCARGPSSVLCEKSKDQRRIHCQKLRSGSVPDVEMCHVVKPHSTRSARSETKSSHVRGNTIIVHSLSFSVLSIARIALLFFHWTNARKP